MEVKFLYFYNHRDEWHCDEIDYSYDTGDTKQFVSIMRVKPEGRRPDFLEMFDKFNERNKQDTHKPVCMINQYGALCLINRSGLVTALDDDNCITVENQYKTHLSVPTLDTVKPFLD